MNVIESPSSRFDPTPEEIAAKAEADWQALDTAQQIERQTVVEQIEHHRRRLIALDQQIAARTGRSQAELGIERVTVAARLAHAEARLVHIGDVIAAHRKARP